LYKGGRKDKEPGLIAMLRGTELEQMGGLMMYVTADKPPLAHIFALFAEVHAAFAPLGGHTIDTIVELRQLIDEYVALSLQHSSACPAASLPLPGTMRP
jgi:hypothetical protein